MHARVQCVARKAILISKLYVHLLFVYVDVAPPLFSKVNNS